MSLRRVVMIAAVMAVGVVGGYGVAAKAWPTPYYRGYFTNAYDDYGTRIWPINSTTSGCNAADGNALPTSVNTAAELIAFTRCKLVSNNGSSTVRAQERTGAAFIIQTMLGDTGPKITSLADPRVQTWADTVTFYDSQGWVSWNVPLTFSLNTYWQGTQPGGTVNDDAAFNDTGGNGSGIRFSAYGKTYEIRHQCANPVGAMQSLTVGTFNLTPTVVRSADNAQQGDTFTFTYRISNSGNAPSSPALCYLRDQNGVAVGGVALSCAGGQVFQPHVPPVQVGLESITVTNQPPGTRICRQLFVAPASSSNGGPVGSGIQCVVIGKTPYVHIRGNDVWAGGGFSAVSPTCNTNAKITTVGRALGGTSPTEYAGSSVEYNAFALNRITSFGSSGRALVGSGAAGSASRRLTFANNEPAVANLGFYGAPQHCIEDYASIYGTTPTGPALPINHPQSGVYHVAGSIASLSGTSLPGRTKVYYVEGNVTITGDIRYPDTYGNVQQIPSILVVATGNIYVSPGVRRIDGQYIARGTFYTCYPKVEPSSVGICNMPLTVNGAVRATNIDLFRTAGADGPTTATRKAPAELFNFNPELYIRNVVNITEGQTLQTLHALELPPRF